MQRPLRSLWHPLLSHTTCTHSTDTSQHAGDVLQLLLLHRTTLSRQRSHPCAAQQAWPCPCNPRGDSMPSTTLPSGNRPQGTGRTQTHSSCTFSCTLLGLHLSGSRNEQVSPGAHQAARTWREASCFHISVAQPPPRGTEGRAQRQLRNLHPADSASK